MPFVTTTCGSRFEYTSKEYGQGGMKKVFMAPDKSYVVCFYKEQKKLTADDRKRVKQVVTTYRKTIFQNAGGKYFTDLMCWPTYMFDNPEDGFGVICPTYPSNFFFQFGHNQNSPKPKKGKEKNGHWFFEVYTRNCLHEKELGDWASYLRIALLVTRMIRRLIGR